METIPREALREEAKVIADLIYNTEHHFTGLLLLYVSQELTKRSQHYTSMLVKDIANEYGFGE